MKSIFFVLLAINLLSIQVASAGEKAFCEESVISMAGSACWSLNIYSTPRIEQKGLDNTVLIDMKIPYFLFDKSKHRKFGPHSVVALNLSIKENDKNRPIQYESYFVIYGSNSEGDAGIQSFVNSFSNKENYTSVGQSKDFYIYRNANQASSFEYFVPKNRLARGLYLVCVKNCSMHSVYRNISYEFYFPIESKESYADLQKLAESFLDSIIVNVEIKGVR